MRLRVQRGNPNLAIKDAVTLIEYRIVTYRIRKGIYIMIIIEIGACGRHG
jgi:hypothetical protein